jgi:hypothetical protein
MRQGHRYTDLRQQPTQAIEIIEMMILQNAIIFHHSL